MSSAASFSKKSYTLFLIEPSSLDMRLAVRRDNQIRHLHHSVQFQSLDNLVDIG